LSLRNSTIKENEFSTRGSEHLHHFHVPLETERETARETARERYRQREGER
jgi:hypothetical protein